ncbi:glycosyltransferase [Sulfobacillus acidophilus]|uniref:Glycosyltransferase n=1 Tax=Sulfobacillus acidophilus TaxID=53633 RepID=A0ABS3AVJ5_9FIRM|nr:glycosyltransferase [Sulfobacillus acidophilus]
MKIAFFSDVYYPYTSGVVTSIINFSKKLNDRGHKVCLFTSEYDENNTNPSPKLEVYRLKSTSAFSNYPGFKTVSPLSFIKCFKAIKKIKPDIIHVHTPTALGWFAYFCGKILKIPVVNTYHTLLGDIGQCVSILKYCKPSTIEKLISFYTRFYYNKSQVIISPSQPIKNYLQSIGIKKPINIVSNGVNFNTFKKIDTQKTAGIKFIHVGRLSFEKNVDVILKSFKKALCSLPSSKLIIVGSGPDELKLKNLAKSLKIDNSIDFVGRLENNLLYKVYSNADIFITASTIETEGIVLLEAMSCGLCVIGVDKLAIPYIIKHNENGLIAQPFCHNEIAKHMVTLGLDKNLRDAFSLESLKKVKQFNLDFSIKKIENSYMQAIKIYSPSLGFDTVKRISKID